MNAVVVCLWLLVLLAFAGPSLARSLAAACRRLRSQGWGAVALAALALAAATLYGGSKGGGTNEPPVTPSAPVKVIRLYYESASGKLYPFDAKMREVVP